MSGWLDPAWRREVDGWVEDHAVRLGLAPVRAIHQPHVRQWGTVLRVETAGGTVWFKATAPELRHEVVLTRLLARRRPELVPPLLAADAERGWLLLADAGRRLRELAVEEQSLARWLDVLPRYARLQVAVAGDVDELLAAGVPDLRLEVLPGRLERLLASLRAPVPVDLAPRVAALAEELARYEIPASVQHDDLHDAQVFVRHGRYAILDWGDACVSHPFFTLSVTLQGVIAWGLEDVEGSVDVAPYREAYLAPWRKALPGVDVDAACELAVPLGWACRAANGHVPEQPEATAARLRMLAGAL